MPKTPLTPANALTLTDGRVLGLAGNIAAASGLFEVGLLDGSGTDLLSTEPFTLNGQLYELLGFGDSHFANSVRPSPLSYLGPFVAAAGTFAAYDHATQFVGVGGIKLAELAADPYFAQIKANVTRVLTAGRIPVVFAEGGTNDGAYSSMSFAPVIAEYMRFICREISKMGALVILTTMVPSDAMADSWPAQQVVVEQIRQYQTDDRVNNWRKEYGAVACTLSHPLDPEIYPLKSWLDFPQYFLYDSTGDRTHMSDAGQQRWSLHLALALVKGLKYKAPARLAPTAMIVDENAETLTFTPTAADALKLHEYTRDGGGVIMPVNSLPIVLPVGTYNPNSLQVRVAAYAGQSAGPWLSNATVYHVGGVPTPGDDEATFSDSTLTTVTGNNILFTQQVADAFRAGVYGDKVFPAGKNASVSTRVNSALRSKNAFIGFRRVADGVVVTGNIPFPQYGYNLDYDTMTFKPTNGGGAAAVIPIVDGDVIEFAREFNNGPSGCDGVYYINGNTTPAFRIQGIPLTDDVMIQAMSAYDGSGFLDVRYKSEVPVLPR
jgi:lysophospholipase L1-like esterase